MLKQFHFTEGHQISKRRFRALVKIDPVHVQAIATAARGRIIKREAEIVAAKEPLEGEARFLVPCGVVGGAVGFQAGGDGAVGLDRLLVKLGRLAAPMIEAVGADGPKISVRRFLHRDEPAQRLKPDFKSARIFDPAPARES